MLGYAVQLDGPCVRAPDLSILQIGRIDGRAFHLFDLFDKLVEWMDLWSQVLGYAVQLDGPCVRAPDNSILPNGRIDGLAVHLFDVSKKMFE